MKKRKVPENYTFRMAPELRLALEEEAAREKRKLSDYLRLLVETHPARSAWKPRRA